MALSGTANYNLTAGSIITKALNLLNVVAPWDTPNTESIDVCEDALNRMIKQWTHYGVHMWTQHEGALVFNYNTATYSFADENLGGSSVGVVKEADLITMTLDDDGAITDTVLTLDSTTGVTANDILLIVSADGTRQQRVVSSVDSATELTLTVALTTAVTSGDTVFCYADTATLFNPRQLYNFRLKDHNGIDRMLTELSRSDYFSINDKTMAGTPTQYFIDNQLVNKQIHVFPVPADLNESLRFTYVKYLDDITSLTQNVEFPLDWLDALIYNLAVRVAANFGRQAALGKVTDPHSIGGLAIEFFHAAQGFADSNEPVDIQIQPNLSNH